MRFDWDPEKNKANHRMHGLSFEEAQTAFFDDSAIGFDDPEHSDDGERFLLLGLSGALRVLVIVHCLRDRGDTVRTISARKATKREREAYEKGMT